MDSNASQAISCWFCSLRFEKEHVQRDGILRSRSEEAGGPFRLYICPSCGRENLCERTARGRWFASPNFRFTLLDYLFSQILTPGAEDLLAAISWFRDNEDRRRYFFEQDGDRRYVGKSFLLRLWPTAKGPGPKAAKSQRTTSSSEERRDSGGGRRREAAGGFTGRRSHGLVTPYEILGVTPAASEREIHAAFQKLAIHYHPDKVYHLGEDFRAMAHGKFAELKNAYDVLLERRRRGGPSGPATSEGKEGSRE